MIRPEVPDPYVNGELVWKYDENTDSVIVPYWYWEKLFDYVVESQEFYAASPQ